MCRTIYVILYGTNTVNQIPMDQDIHLLIHRDNKTNELMFIWVEEGIQAICGIASSELTGKTFSQLEKEYPEQVKHLAFLHKIDLKSLTYHCIYNSNVYSASFRLSSNNNTLVLLKPADSSVNQTHPSIESIFGTIFPQTADAFFLLCNRVFINCNESCVSLLGASGKSDIIGKTPVDISPEFQDDGVPSSLKADMMMNKARTKGSHLFEWKHTRMNNEPFLAEVSLTYSEHEGKEYFLTIVRDISEKQLREQELKQSETRYKTLADNSNDVIWLMDLQMRTTYMSPSIERQLGYTPEEYIKMQFEEKIAGDGAAYFKKTFSEMLPKVISDPTYYSFNAELQYHHKNGSVIWGESSISFIRNEQNQLVEILGVTRNIDERKKTEEALALGKEKYRAIVDAYDGLIYICSSDYVVEFMNENFIDRTGFNGIGGKCYEVLHELKEKCPWCVNDRVSKGEKVKWEVKSPKDNRWYQITNTPIYKPDGSVSKQAMIQDITESKLAEIALTESESKFRALSESSPSAVFIYQGHKFKYLNPATEELTSFTREELLRMNFYDVIHPDHFEFVKERGMLRQKGADLPPRYEFKIARKNGETRWIDFTGTVIDFEGEPAVLGTAYDITEKKTAEESLIKSEEKYRSLVNLAVDGIIIGDHNGNVIEANRRFLEIFNITTADIYGHHISSLFSPNVLEENPLRFDLIRQGQTIINERKIIKADGTEAFIEMHSKMMPDGKYQSFFRDITQRKTDELQLNEQKRFLETLIGNLPGIVYRCKNDKNWSMEFISGRCEELTGYPPEDFILNKKRSFNSIILKDHQERLWSKWQQILKKREIFIDEYIINTGDGKKKWVYEQGAGVYDEEGRLLALEGFISDITDRKVAEEQLVSSQFNFKMLAGYNQLLSRAALVFAVAQNTDELENMIATYYQRLTGGIMTLVMQFDSKRELLYLSNYIMPDQIKNMSVQLFGSDVFQYTIPLGADDQKRFLHDGLVRTETIEEVSFGAFPIDLLNLLQKEAGIKEVIVAVMHKQNHIMGTITTFIQDKSTIPNEILKTFAQLAGFALSRKKTEIELIEAKEKAEKSDKMKSMFLANISHEIRTPMNAILGFAELLQRPVLDYSERIKYTEIISDSGHQLLGIIDDLIDLAKIETGQMKIIINPFNPKQLINNLYNLFLPRYSKKDLELIVELPKQSDSMLIESDELRVRQILTNLIDNAYKYTIRGQVRFGYTIFNDSIEFFVADTGIGIKKEDEQRIFERFVQLEHAQTDQFGGKGLGLSISRSLSELLNGEIRVLTGKNGTVFYLLLPLKRAN